MTDVKVRKIDFQFDEDIPFRFNPRNIGASDWVNAATLIAPEFEGHFIKVIRGVMPQLSGPVKHEPISSVSRRHNTPNITSRIRRYSSRSTHSLKTHETKYTPVIRGC